MNQNQLISTLETISASYVKVQKDNAAFVEALEYALPYIEGAYECAFPDASENDYVLVLARAALENAKGVSNEG